MSTLSTLIGRSLRFVGALSPPLAARLALRAFFTTAPRIAVRDTDAATDLAARVRLLRVRGRLLTTYEWGTGERTVLLLHGWRGRASQFAPLIRELTYEGFRVVSFDAPAHGRSVGGRADIRDWVAAAEALHARYGQFRAIVGHSLGGLAALTVARSIAPTEFVAVVSGVGSPDPFMSAFARDFRLDARTAGRVKARFLARLGEDERSASLRYDAVLHPLPPGTELLVVHDIGDRRMPDTDARRLHEVHAERSRMLHTTGFGHTRILTSDTFLDAVTAVATGGLAALDDPSSDDRAELSGLELSSASHEHHG
ncbi:alpha/beta fold hydrolase [Ruania halotolerans]|uniref:alpha/beta fold hydrolase n=1 Tax=Ruania halotolerans TaxID=2897773 RepID=UPI001E629545|nr:alpha/beta fold hydrolase [Ruania halotolerans]UFU08185.1 alpha/beta hydrolase [Ruania halotolerans]